MGIKPTYAIHVNTVPNHKRKWIGIAMTVQLLMSNQSDEQFLKFTEYYKKEPLPCIIYADLECSLQERNKDGEFSNDDEEDCDMGEQIFNDNFSADECDEEPDCAEWYDIEEFRMKKKTNMERSAFRKHIPYSLAYYYLHRYDESKSYYQRHRGRSCIRKFASDLEQLAQDIEHEIVNPAPLKMTEEDRNHYEATNICHSCEKGIVDPSDKVILHNHRDEGKYRGPAHVICNLHCIDPPTVVGVLHGSANYDNHFLIRDMCNVIPGEVTLIPESSEKYISS
ncbi:hypothetical protein QAD02_007652 [Eretmocerus hayati]|uniref:Uncharacterized protein n=1 Tax=Eretmocerus hayati TaxID=131215 RepID=A0ACC2N489_9HYME|nr:hypothetical protein QAD02_007652 [Eretmocerus hayati]